MFSFFVVRKPQQSTRLWLQHLVGSLTTFGSFKVAMPLEISHIWEGGFRSFCFFFTGGFTGWATLAS